MEIIMRDAEKALMERLPALVLNDPHHRCLFLRLSQVVLEHEDWAQHVVRAVRAVLEDNTAQIYICHDRDVFILNRTLTSRRLDQFTTHLTQLLAPASLEGLASLFEVGIHADRLRSLCTRKIEQIEIDKARAAKMVSAPQAASGTSVYQAIDRDMILSLGRRRAERKTLEILAVEDDPFSQKLIKNAIGKHYEVTVTGDGRGAILNYIAKAPDILFLDIGLPDIDGHEVLKKIFEIDPAAYVVMFSGKGDRENITRAVERGAKGFVGKPFTHDKLFHYIDQSPFTIEKSKGGSHGHYSH